MAMHGLHACRLDDLIQPCNYALIDPASHASCNVLVNAADLVVGEIGVFGSNKDPSLIAWLVLLVLDHPFHRLADESSAPRNQNNFCHAALAI